MNAQLNGSALDPREVNIPSQEPGIAILANDNINVDGRGKGGLTRELNDPALANGTSATEQERVRQADPTPVLPGYLAEKYSLQRSAGGKWYLSPLVAFMEYVAGTKARQEKLPDGTVRMIPATDGAASRAADYGIGIIYPHGEHGKTDEADKVELQVAEATALLQTYRATNEGVAKRFERFLIDNVTRDATYAATTQFELESWQANAAARGQNAADHPSYAQKDSKLQSFAIAAGIALAVARRVLPETYIGADTFNKASSRIVYDNASFEGDKLFKPAQAAQQKKAEADATKALVRRF